MLHRALKKGRIEGEEDKRLYNGPYIVDENGLSHDLFQTYYCAFYIYELLCDNKEVGEEKLKEIANNVDKQYWADVLEMLICLVEYYANPADEDCCPIAEVLMNMLDIMI